MKKCCFRTPQTRTSHRALDIESEEVINTAFGVNLARLRAIKRKCDPANFFRVNYNIKPVGAEAGAA